MRGRPGEAGPRGGGGGVYDPCRPPPQRCVSSLREPRAPQAEGWGLRGVVVVVRGVSASRSLSRGGRGIHTAGKVI